MYYMEQSSRVITTNYGDWISSSYLFRLDLKPKLYNSCFLLLVVFFFLKATRRIDIQNLSIEDFEDTLFTYWCDTN